MATLAQMRTYLADYMELDDIPNSLTDAWLREGHRRVQNHSDWHWLYQTKEVAITRARPLTGTTPVSNVHRVLSVTSTESEVRDLERLPSWNEAMRRYGLSHDDGGRPLAYTAMAGPGQTGNATVFMRLWPASTTDVSNTCLLRVRIEPEDWPLATTAVGDSPPLPPAFHDIIQMWALSELMQREGMADDARSQLSRYHQGLAALASQYVNVSASDLRVGGGDTQSALTL